MKKHYWTDDNVVLIMWEVFKSLSMDVIDLTKIINDLSEEQAMDAL
jgi:hypothetical protein